MIYRLFLLQAWTRKPEIESRLLYAPLPSWSSIHGLVLASKIQHFKQGMLSDSDMTPLGPRSSLEAYTHYPFDSWDDDQQVWCHIILLIVEIAPPQINSLLALSEADPRSEDQQLSVHHGKNFQDLILIRRIQWISTCSSWGGLSRMFIPVTRDNLNEYCENSERPPGYIANGGMISNPVRRIRSVRFNRPTLNWSCQQPIVQ